MKRALYDILRVEQTASEQEIKTAYRKLAAHYHPDVFWGDKEYAEEIMKEINHAYAILSDPESRRIYDAELRIQQEAEKQDEERQPPKPANTETKAAQNIDENRTSKYRFRWRNAICYIIFFIIFALVSVLLLRVSVYLWPDDEVSRNIDTAFNPTSLTLPDISIPEIIPEIAQETTTISTDLLQTKEKNFTLGSSKEEVKNIMGTPSEIHDYTSFTAWYYRDGYMLSTVTFDETGHVNEWTNAGNLKVWLGDKLENAAPFTLGASQKQVLNAMGTPNEVHSYTFFTVWYYRDGYMLSTVTFDETGHVDEWINAGNLKLK